MDGFVTIGTEIETKSFDKQIKDLENKLDTLEQEYETLKKAKPYEGQEEDLIKIRSQMEKTKNSIIGLQKQQLKLNENHFFENASNSISSIIKKTLKWAVALFGIRSAYSFISKSMSTLSQYNQQIGTDLSYIQFAMATALEPLIETIIQLAYKLLNIINSISVALFGYNIFLNSSAKKFGSMSKSAKDIKKSLAGFDEMNVIQDNSASGGGGGISTPSVDLSELTDTESGEKFKSFWEDIIQFWEHDWFDAFNSIDNEWGIFMLSLGLAGKAFYDIFKGIIDVVVGLWNMLVGLFTGDTEKLKEGWNLFIQGLKEILIGFVEGIISIVGMLVGAVWGLLVNLGKMIWAGIEGLINIILDLIHKGIDFILSILAPIGTAIEKVLMFIWDGIVKLVSKGGEILGAIGSWIYNHIIQPVGNFFGNLWNGILNGAKNAWNGIKNAFGAVTSFFSNIIKTVLNSFKSLGSKAGSVISSAFKAVVNGVLKTIESVLNTPIKAINKLIGVINGVPGINLSKLSTFSLPRLAKGGIVNMPGRGVPVGNAITGERGSEGVIPLTDSQQMALLGEAIGKYITINATITNTMNGRVLSRELKRIENEDTFSFNR